MWIEKVLHVREKYFSKTPQIQHLLYWALTSLEDNNKMVCVNVQSHYIQTSYNITFSSPKYKVSFFSIPKLNKHRKVLFKFFSLLHWMKTCDINSLQSKECRQKNKQTSIMYHLYRGNLCCLLGVFSRSLHVLWDPNVWCFIVKPLPTVDYIQLWDRIILGLFPHDYSTQ